VKRAGPLPLMIVGLGLALSLALMARMADAQQSAAPEAGAGVLEDPLTQPGLITPFTCPTQRAGVDFVGEGLRLKLTGRCNQADVFTAVGPIIRGLDLPDGEVRLDVKAVSGLDRVRFLIQVRLQPREGGIPDGYAAAIEPGLGRALIGKVISRQITYMAEGTDLAGRLSPDDWNTIAFRLRGPDMWLLLNEQPILSAADVALDRGEVLLLIGRLGGGPLRLEDDPNDMTEVAVVVRNLRISGLALADGDPARAPTYQRP
jgi:hypothetical protein